MAGLFGPHLAQMMQQRGGMGAPAMQGSGQVSMQGGGLQAPGQQQPQGRPYAGMPKYERQMARHNARQQQPQPPQGGGMQTMQMPQQPQQSQQQPFDMASWLQKNSPGFTPPGYGGGQPQMQSSMAMQPQQAVPGGGMQQGFAGPLSMAMQPQQPQQMGHMQMPPMLPSQGVQAPPSFFQQPMQPRPMQPRQPQYDDSWALSPSGH